MADRVRGRMRNSLTTRCFSVGQGGRVADRMEELPDRRLVRCTFTKLAQNRRKTGKSIALLCAQCRLSCGIYIVLPPRNSDAFLTGWRA